MAKATADIRSLVRAQTELAIRTLTGVCGSKGAQAAARMSAAQALLDRGWGKGREPQPHAGEDDKDTDHHTFREVVYEEEGDVGYLSFDFYNGAMSTAQCYRLLGVNATNRTGMTMHGVEMPPQPHLMRPRGVHPS